MAQFLRKRVIRTRRELDALYVLETAVLAAHARGEQPERSVGVRQAAAALLAAIDAELTEHDSDEEAADREQARLLEEYLDETCPDRTPLSHVDGSPDAARWSA